MQSIRLNWIPYVALLPSNNRCSRKNDEQEKQILMMCVRAQANANLFEYMQDFSRFSLIFYFLFLFSSMWLLLFPFRALFFSIHSYQTFVQSFFGLLCWIDANIFETKNICLPMHLRMYFKCVLRFFFVSFSRVWFI